MLVKFQERMTSFYWELIVNKQSLQCPFDIEEEKTKKKRRRRDEEEEAY